MRSAGIYLVQAQIGTCKLTTIPQGQINLTLRIGKSSVSINHVQQQQSKQANFNLVLQLNVDNAGLQTQRCSITLTHNKQNEKKPLGLALISIPKDKNMIQNVYRLTQSQDKKAQIQVRITISQIDSISSSLNKNLNLAIVSNNSRLKPDTIMEASQNSNSASKTTGRIVKHQSLNSIQNFSDKVSQQPSVINTINQNRKNNMRSFKIQQNDKSLNISQSQLKSIKQEKQAYYQLYQIEKIKSQAAIKFINNIIKKIGGKYPDLLTLNNDKWKNDSSSKDKNNVKNPAAQNAQKLASLQQANRSLHRQNQQYKKIIQQLKVTLVSQNKKQQNTLKVPQGNSSSKKGSIIGLDLYDISGNKDRQKSKDRLMGNILPSNILAPGQYLPSQLQPSKITTQHDQKKASAISISSGLKDIDFQKWLDLSIGQRNTILKLLQKIPQKQSIKNEKILPIINKLKKSIDKVFILFLNKKEATKQVLLGHKNQLNKIIDELNA